jgi:hypothetical protein
VVAVPSYIAANASRGLDLLEYAGDGLRPATVREARAMAGGNVSENKVTRMAAWFARHRVDLDSPKANEYLRGETDRPTPGQVAWLLWGGSLGQDRMNAMTWAERTRDRLEKQVSDHIEKALPASYRQADDIRNCGNCKYAAALNNGLWCLRWDAEVQASGMCDAWKPHHMHAEAKGYDDEEKGYGYDLRKEVVEENGEFCVYSEDRGRRFGCYPTLGAAEERLAQIESFTRSLDEMTPEQLIAAHHLTEKAVGDELVGLARSIIEDRLEAIGFAPPYTTGDTTEKLAALHHVVPFAKAEERYTLGPVYVPGRLDGHGEFIDAPTLQKAIWDWVRSGDRTIFLQHSEKAAGEMVEILTWPMPIATSLSLPGEEIRKVEFPAETPFMGVVWESWAWELIKAGQLRGYSIGGKARRIEADLSLTSASE